MSPFDPPVTAVRAAVARALEEDLTPLGDLSSALLPPEAQATAQFVSRDAGVLAGVACAVESFHQVDPAISCTWGAADGDAVTPGQVLGTVEGRLAPILTRERTALHFLRHPSRVAPPPSRLAEA